MDHKKTQEEARALQQRQNEEAAAAFKKKMEEREREKLQKKWARYHFLNTGGYTAAHNPANNKDAEMREARRQLQEKYSKALSN